MASYWSITPRYRGKGTSRDRGTVCSPQNSICISKLIVQIASPSMDNSDQSPLDITPPEIFIEIATQVPYTPRSILDLISINKHLQQIIFDSQRAIAVRILHSWGLGDSKIFYHLGSETPLEFPDPGPVVLPPYESAVSMPAFQSLWYPGAPQYFPVFCSSIKDSFSKLATIYWRCQHLNRVSALAHLALERNDKCLCKKCIPKMVKWNAAGLLLLYRMVDSCGGKHSGYRIRFLPIT